MKNVTKGSPPQSFEAWKMLANPDWVPTYGNLQNPQKRALHESLLEEQGWVCCYCGRDVTIRDSHIEHFRPQTQYEDLALSYENLFASCIRETAPGMPLHCGHAKDDDFDEERYISPLDTTCEGRFLYTLLGEVSPTDLTDERAAYMVDLVQLDIQFLRNRREEALQRTFDADFLASATDDELRKLQDAFQRHDNAGHSENFGHVLARYAGQRLADRRGGEDVAAQAVQSTENGEEPK